MLCEVLLFLDCVVKVFLCSDCFNIQPQTFSRTKFSHLYGQTCVLINVQQRPSLFLMVQSINPQSGSSNLYLILDASGQSQRRVCVGISILVHADSLIHRFSISFFKNIATNFHGLNSCLVEVVGYDQVE